MNFPLGPELQGEALRQKALAVLAVKAASRPAKPASFAEVEALVHELEVHQIELEMQNEELRRVQGDLEASRMRYFDLYDLAPVGYMTVAESGLVLEANLTIAALLGVHRSALLDHPIYDYIHPEDQDQYYLYRRKLFETKAPQACDLRLLQRNSAVWVHLTSTVATIRGGMTVCRVAVVDISERKQFEVALDAERERLVVTLESIADGVITTDAAGKVVSLNPEAEKLTGWSRAEALGHPLEDVYSALDPETRAPLVPSPGSGLAGGQALEVPQPTLLSRDGTERVVAHSAGPIVQAPDQNLGTVVVFRDITERLRLLENIQKTDKLGALGVLAGGIAHDFNNLLGGIFGYITMARDLGDPGPVTIKYLDKAASVFHRAQALTRQLLTFSKGGAPDKHLGDLGALIKETAEFALSGSNVLGRYSLAPDLWPCDFDHDQMAQVFDNLVINSRQAMPGGGVLKISAENVVLDGSAAPLGKPGRFLHLTFSDDGEGIQPRDIPRVFDPFFTTKQTGTGLGLATCHSIIQKHEGTVSVQSVWGHGCTFEILLPASQGACTGVPQASGSSHHGAGTILLMDDEAMMREIVGRLLADMGYTVVEVATGSAALEALGSGRPICAAILDLTIRGGMGGADTVHAIRRQFPELPVFASSGFSEDPVMSQPGQYGFTDSIRKPYRKEDLAALLEKYRVGQEAGGPPG